MYGYGYEDYEPQEGHPFDEAINKLIEFEVNRRVKERIHDYDNTKKSYESVLQALKDRNREYHALTAKLDEAEATFIKEGKDQALREMLGGYKLGDEVWFVRYISKSVECPTCSDKSKVVTKFGEREIISQCPDCNYGRLITSYPKVTKGKITQIGVKTWAEGRCFELKFYVEWDRNQDSREFRSYDSIFSTKEEAEASIKKED